MVCVKCVERGPLYSALRSVPTKVIHGNAVNRLQEDQNRLPAKMHLDRCLPRFGRTPGSAEPSLNPVQVHFGGKIDPILLRAVWHVSMYRDGGNRPLKL